MRALEWSPPNTQKPKTTSKSYDFPRPREIFLTVDRQFKTNFPADRHSKVVQTARPPEYNRPFLIKRKVKFYLSRGVDPSLMLGLRFSKDLPQQKRKPQQLIAT